MGLRLLSSRTKMFGILGGSRQGRMREGTLSVSVSSRGVDAGRFSACEGHYRMNPSSARSSSSDQCSTTGSLPPSPQKTSKVTPPSLEAARVPTPPPCKETMSPGFSSMEAWRTSIVPARQIFCNRTLNMGNITAVGFDMDYTLAQYRPESFELLVYRETIKKLVEALGYPLEVLELEFEWRFMVRGLTIDKKRGNILKMDRHKYVKIAYHGFRRLTREERRSMYGSSSQNESYDEPDFALIDTLFSLAEAHLFAQLVDIIDAEPDIMPQGKSYADIYRDVRTSVDLVHRDGSLKQAVAKNPEAFIYRDESLKEMLDMLRQTGRKVFIVTNSLWDYTNVVMNFILENRSGADKDLSWMKHFDLVVAGSGKPAFFLDAAKPMFEVDTATGMLMNTDNGTPLVPIGHDATLTPLPDIPSLLKPLDDDGNEICRVYQGGNYRILHGLLGVKSGSEVLYVGDHIYGDIVKSKKSLGWRTMLVVPELEHELEILLAQQQVPSRLRSLRSERAIIEDQIHKLEWQITNTTPEGSLGDAAGTSAKLKELKDARERVRAEHTSLLKAYHESFHSIWGQLMKTGYQNSRFASQVERFACLYTSHVSNLRGYSPEKIYTSRDDDMPHEPM